MASKTLLMLFIVLIWNVTAHGQNPPVLAINTESQPASWDGSGIHGRADLGPGFHPQTPLMGNVAGSTEALPSRHSGPLPATITVLLAGLLTALIMQTRR